MAAYAQEMQVRNLKVDLLQKPMLQVVNGYPAVGGEAKTDEQSLIRNRQPILGWELSSTAQGAMQSAYRVMVATHPDSLAKGIADAWDSGKVMSNESASVGYEGAPLTPNTDYAWQVMVWNQEGVPTGWSPVSRFLTADTLVDYQTAFYPLLKTDEIPQRVSTSGNEIRVDFGKASFGQLRLTLTSNKAVDTLTVRLGEAINTDGTINREPGGTIRMPNTGFRYSAGGIPIGCSSNQTDGIPVGKPSRCPLTSVRYCRSGMSNSMGMPGKWNPAISSVRRSITRLTILPPISRVPIRY